MSAAILWGTWGFKRMLSCLGSKRLLFLSLFFFFWKQCVIIITIWHLTSPRFPHIVDKTSSFIVILCTDMYTWIYSILRRSRRKKKHSLTFSPYTYADTHWHKTHAVKQEMETMMKPVCNVLAWNTQKDWQTSIIPSKRIIIYVSENVTERYKGSPTHTWNWKRRSNIKRSWLFYTHGKNNGCSANFVIAGLH